MGEQTRFLDFGSRPQFSKARRTTLGLNYGTEVLIKKGFHLTHKNNIKKKTRETITLIVDTMKISASKYSTEMLQGQYKK